MLGELVEPRPWEVAGGCQAADHAAARQRTREDLELRSGKHLAEIGDLDRDPAVGPIGAIAKQCVVVGQAVHALGPLDVGERQQLAHEWVRRGDHVVLLDERQLHVQLGELRLAIGTEVLVAKAAGDLVVALEPAHHQQLLEQLGDCGSAYQEPGCKRLGTR